MTKSKPNNSNTEKPHQSVSVRISRKDAYFFSLSIGDNNSAYFDEKQHAIVPASPMYAAALSRNPVSAMLKDPSLGIAYEKILHYSQCFDWHRPLYPGDLLVCNATLTEIQQKDSGRLIVFETNSYNQNKEKIVSGKWVFLEKALIPNSSNQKNKSSTETNSPIFEYKIDIPKWQTFAYAEASGDRNPIHLYDKAAKNVGLPGIIIHGLCTMSLCHKELVNKLCQGNPRLIKTLSVCFSKPIFPGNPIFLRGIDTNKSEEGETVSFVAQNQEGITVLKNSFCILEKTPQTAV